MFSIPHSIYCLHRCIACLSYPALLASCDQATADSAAGALRAVLQMDPGQLQNAAPVMVVALGAGTAALPSLLALTADSLQTALATSQSTVEGWLLELCLTAMKHAELLVGSCPQSSIHAAAATLVHCGAQLLAEAAAASSHSLQYMASLHAAMRALIAAAESEAGSCDGESGSGGAGPGVASGPAGTFPACWKACDRTGALLLEKAMRLAGKAQVRWCYTHASCSSPSMSKPWPWTQAIDRCILILCIRAGTA